MCNRHTWYPTECSGASCVATPTTACVPRCRVDQCTSHTCSPFVSPTFPRMQSVLWATGCLWNVSLSSSWNRFVGAKFELKLQVLIHSNTAFQVWFTPKPFPASDRFQHDYIIWSAASALHTISLLIFITFWFISWTRISVCCSVFYALEDEVPFLENHVDLAFRST